MTTRYVPAGEISSRYETHRSKILTLYVVRQNQTFSISNDVQTSDIELIRSSVELVGEPGWGQTTQVGRGHVQGAYDSAGGDASVIAPTYGTTINSLYAMNQTGTSKVRGVLGENAVVHKTHINHGWVDISIKGLTDGGEAFMQDSLLHHGLNFVLPTDSGLLSIRSAQQAGLSTPFKLESVQLEPSVRVITEFAGSWPKNARQARFAEDFADTNTATYRNADGTIKYFSASGLGPCQIPANMINSMMLQFKITPTSDL